MGKEAKNGKLAMGGMQIVRHTHTRVQGTLLLVAMVFFSFYLVRSFQRRFGSICMATFLNVRVSDSHAAECAQVI